MNTLLLKISTPDGDRFCDQVEMVSVRTTEGELAVMAGHAGFAAALVPCQCRIETPDGTRTGHLEDGLLSVDEKGARILSGSFTWDEE